MTHKGCLESYIASFATPSYRNIFNLAHQNHLWSHEEDMMFMRRIGAMREDKTDRITCQTGDGSGNVFDFLLKVIPKLRADLKVPFVLNGNLRDENKDTIVGLPEID